MRLNHLRVYGNIGFAISLMLLASLACQLEYLLPSEPTATATAAPTVTRTKAPAMVVPTPLPPLPVATTPPQPPPGPVAGKAKDNLRIRALPSTTANILDRFNKGDTIQVTGRTAANDWLQVILPTNPNQRGWVSAEFVDLSAPLDRIPVTQPGAPSSRPYP